MAVCGSPHIGADVNGWFCQLSKGHTGPHEIQVTESWEWTPDDDEY